MKVFCRARNNVHAMVLLLIAPSTSNEKITVWRNCRMSISQLSQLKCCSPFREPGFESCLFPYKPLSVPRWELITQIIQSELRSYLTRFLEWSLLERNIDRALAKNGEKKYWTRKSKFRLKKSFHAKLNSNGKTLWRVLTQKNELPRFKMTFSYLIETLFMN